MSANGQRRWMVGKHHDAEGLAAVLEILVDGGEDLTVDFLDGDDLIFHLCALTALVGTFYVNVDEISAVLECLNGGLRLAVVIGVNVTRCTLYVDGLHVSTQTDTLDQVHGRNDSAVESPFLLEVGLSYRLLHGQISHKFACVEICGLLPRRCRRDAYLSRAPILSRRQDNDR